MRSSSVRSFVVVSGISLPPEVIRRVAMPQRCSITQNRPEDEPLTYLLTYLGRAKRSHHGTVWLHRHPESFYLAFPRHPVSKHCFAVSKKGGFVSEQCSVLNVASARMPVNEMEKTV